MAKENITVNGRVYKAKELDFNFLCNLGDNGIDISDIDKKMLPALRVPADDHLLHVRSCPRGAQRYRL